MQLKDQLKQALADLLPPEATNLEVVIQDVPADKDGDYGSPIAFLLAKTLKKNPAQVAADLAAEFNGANPVQGIREAKAVGPFLNFFVDTAGFVAGVVNSKHEITPKNRKVIIEHTSVNPNKEWHVGHIRGALIGDAMARIYRSSGYTVEVQNYIDDTGRQAADSQFAIRHYGETWDGKQKYDHWLGELYVRLHHDFPEKSEAKKSIEPEVTEVIHALERGELREEIAKVLRSQLETAYSLGIEYDLLVWESDVVRAGFVEKALEIFGGNTLARKAWTSPLSFPDSRNPSRCWCVATERSFTKPKTSRITTGNLDCLKDSSISNLPSNRVAKNCGPQARMESTNRRVIHSRTRRKS
jgi:arginyl-tRNA synthetase